MNHDPRASGLSRPVLVFGRSAFRALFVASVFTTSALAANWPSWRGPNGDGTTTTARNLPANWAPETNVKWKREMPAWSGSSPVIWGDRIFLNSPSKEEPAETAKAPTTSSRRRAGRSPATSGPGGQDLLLLCLSRATGEEIWRQKYDQGNMIQMKHNMSSPTPVTNGERVWVISGNGVVACYDLEGNAKWTFNIVEKYGKIGTNFGYGSSPLLLDGNLILQVLHGQKTDEPSYVFALEGATGKVLWRVERPTDAIGESPDAYTTPALLTVGGKKQVVVSGGGYATGHDPATGKELWRSGGLNPSNARDFRVISSPLVRDGMIFVPTRQVPLLALKAGGMGDITSSHLAWSWTDKRSGPDVPTPVSDGERFYMVNDGGLITCLDAKTGKLIYGPEDTGVGRVSASPILADGKIHVISETAETAVIQAGSEYKLLGKNALDGSYTLCTPAFADEEIFIRTGTHLYCLKK